MEQQERGDALEDLLPQGHLDALTAGMKVGPWRVLGKLGQGGFGGVFVVRRRGRLYAMKVAARAEDARFEREAELLRRVRHPAVVRLRGTGTWTHRGRRYPYVVMDYVEGKTLERWAEESNPTPRQVALLLAQLAEALGAVHAAGARHRDVKGSNVLLRLPEGRPVLADFGAGYHEGASTITRGNVPPGTPLYFSPEAARFRLDAAQRPDVHYDFTPGDDLYALGVTFFHVLTEDHPYANLPRGDYFILAHIAHAPVRAAVDLNPHVPRSFSDVLLKLLAKDPQQRCTSAQLVQALEAALADGDARWDAPLFDWYEGPSSHSKTTEEVGPWKPIAPGQEALMAHDPPHREVVWRWREKREVRRRNPAQVRAAEAPGRPRWGEAARARHTRATLRRARVPLALAAGAAVLAVATWALWPQRAATPPPPHEMALAPGPPQASTAAAAPGGAPTPAAKDASPVNTPKPSAPPKKPSTPNFKGRAAAAVCAGGIAACTGAGAQVRPPPRDCPHEALKAMEKLGIKPGNQFTGYIDTHRFDRGGDYPVPVHDGAIVSRIAEEEMALPVGTLLHGQLWTSDKDVVWGRYFQAQLPGESRRIPVCIVLGHTGFWEKHTLEDKKPADWKPGTSYLLQSPFFTVVDRFK